MFKSGAQYTKLKTNLRLAVNRLKLLEKKKTELAQKARNEIADYITGNKHDRARIRVEYIIREDYLVEAYELLEMFCDLLLARFGLVQQMKMLDEGIEEAVNSLLWAAPRLQTDIQELKIISDQLTIKYGKPFAEACRQNQLGKVNQKLIQKLTIYAPPKILVEKYMMEIAKSHGIPFEPDHQVLRNDEIMAAEAMLLDFHAHGQAYGRGYPNPRPPGPGGYPPPPPSYPPGGGVPIPVLSTTGAPWPHNQTQPFAYPPLKQSAPGNVPNGTAADSYTPDPVKLPRNPDPKGRPSAPPAFHLPDPPALEFPPTSPVVNGAKPDNNPKGNDGEEDIDFDDLTKRFENLKKRR